MSTFLELCQSLRQECGVSGTGPTAVTSQTGMNKKLVDWINRAWKEVQSARPDWLWMRKSFSFSTIASTGNYTASGISLTDVGNWYRYTFRVYLTSGGVAGEVDLPWIPYDDWRDGYGIGEQVEDFPICFTIKPDKSLQIAPIPNSIYTISGEYRQSAQSLSANADEPGLPAEFHNLIIYKAMMFYGAHEGAPDVYADGKEQYRILRNAMILDQTSPMEDAEPLA